MYFTMGGRGSQGGVYRIKYQPTPDYRPQPVVDNNSWLPHYQPFSAFGRAQNQRWADLRDGKGQPATAHVDNLQKRAAGTFKSSTANRIYALNYLQNHGLQPDVKLLRQLLRDEDGDIRAHAVWLLGVNGYKEGKDGLLRALKDNDAMVRRRACEA